MSDHLLSLPDEFKMRVSGAFGDAGVAWLDRLPDLLGTCADRWSLDIGEPFSLSYNFVAPAVRADGTPVVLKLHAPDTEAVNEVAALALFNGDGICRLIDHDPDLAATLLERVQPGVPLAGLATQDDEAATDIAIGIFKRLWRPAPATHTFRTLEDRIQGFDRHRRRFGGSVPLPARLFEEGESLFRSLLQTAPREMLMHGDLHHENILSATRELWLAIDPKGLVGDPGYDLGAFLYNPMPDLLSMPDPPRVIARRIDQLADGLDMERQRVRGWGMGQAILSAIWSIEDSDDWRYVIAFAEILSSIPE